jgi:hypothetical protein
MGCERRYGFKEIKIPMAYTIDQLQSYSDKIVLDYASDSFKKNAVAVFDYLMGKTPVLAGVTTDFDNSRFSYLTDLLKLPSEWDPNDQLILNVLVDSAIWPYVNVGMTTLLTRRVNESGTAQDWDILIAFLQKRLRTYEIFQFIVSASRGLYDLEIGTSEDSIKSTWLKNYLKGVDKNILGTLMQYYGQSSFNCNFLGLLIDCVPAEVDNYLQSNIVNNQQFNTHVIYPALYYNAEKYLPYIIEKIKENSFNQNRAVIEKRFTVIMMLQYKHPGSVNDLLIQIANDYLAMYLTIENKGWENPINYDNERYTYSELSAKILLEQDKIATKEKLWDIIQQTKYLHYSVLSLLIDHFKEDALPFVLKGLHAELSVSGYNYHKQVLALLVNFKKEKYSESLWELVKHKSKQVRQLLIPVLSTDDNAIEKSAALLGNKNADIRQTAAQILSIIPSPEAKVVLQKAIANEKNDDARDIMLQAVSDDLYSNVDDKLLEQLIEDARNRGKLNKPLEEWLTEESLPVLYYTNGEQVSQDAVRFLLYRMNRIKAMRSELEARLIIDRLDKEKAASFALHLIKLFIDNGTKSEHKYLLALSALLGNEMVADKIRITIDKWIDDSRFKMAEYGVVALALQGSNKALRWVELYSRKYRNKKANVGAAALLALESAAEELNITVYELGDRIVPDFGFEGLFKQFTIEGEAYRAFIDSNFKIAYFNDDNKKLKAIPAAADNALKDEFKAIAKEVRDVVKSQSSRLEHYLVVQRQWNREQWQQFFLTNPIMFIYATKLLWGIYDTNNVLQQCFYCQEDTTLMDAEDNEISLPQEALIGIVHPLQLLAGDVQKWQRTFFDLSIEPVFPQLDRSVYSLAPENRQVTVVRTFAETKTEPGSIKSILEKYGWRKGPTGDAGSIDMFLKDDYAGNITTVLEVEGVFVAGFDSDMDPRLGRLYFLNKPIGKTGWLVQPKNDDDPRLVPLGNLAPVFYSEVMAGIKAIKVRNTSVIQ